MKRSEKFSEALGNIDSKYIEEALSYGKKEKDSKYTEISVVHQNKRKHHTWLAAVSAAACICIVFFGANMLKNRHVPAFSPETENYSAEYTNAEEDKTFAKGGEENGQTEETADEDKQDSIEQEKETLFSKSEIEHEKKEPLEEDTINTVQEIDTDEAEIRTGAPTLYSKLVKNTMIPELDYSEYALANFAFEDDLEKNIKSVTAIIEGEITDIYVKNYEYTTAFDKFEQNGVLHNRNDNVVYKIKAEKVLFGDIQQGETVTVEDDFFIPDVLSAVKIGSRYVIPICSCGDKILTTDEVTDGDISRDSIYCSYSFLDPRIEAVDGGYIVPDTWKTLVTDKCPNITLDLQCGYGYEHIFKDRMYFVPSDIFEKQINILIDRELKN